MLKPTKTYIAHKDNKVIVCDLYKDHDIMRVTLNCKETGKRIYERWMAPDQSIIDRLEELEKK